MPWRSTRSGFRPAMLSPLQKNPAHGRRVDPAHDVEDGCLPSPVWSDKADDLAPIHDEVEIVNGPKTSEDSRSGPEFREEAPGWPRPISLLFASCRALPAPPTAPIRLRFELTSPATRRPQALWPEQHGQDQGDAQDHGFSRVQGNRAQPPSERYDVGLSDVPLATDGYGPRASQVPRWLSSRRIVSSQDRVK